jgi:class 3 adenylate cyclase
VTGVAGCPNCGAVVRTGARFCDNCGSPLSSPATEERKLATILFADVTGSTDLGEQLDPERLRALLAEFFAAMAQVIEQWGGTVEKYIGDAILAVFGVPAAREDDAIRALHAGAEMLESLAAMNDGFEQRHGVRLALRIGVNTGEVLAPAGAQAGGQFLVSGDAVNVAARLEQAADPGSILVGERTWSAARHAFSFAEPTPLSVKGKRGAVVARRLGDPIAADTEVVEGVHFQAPMVGRDRELETLVGLLDQAIETLVPRLVVVAGPAGMGKSRLLREFVAAAGDRHERLTVLRGRCLAAGHGITFWALGEVLRSAARISLDEPAETAVAKLQGTAATILEPLGLREAEFNETVHALATSAGLTMPGNPLERIEPEQVAEAMARAWPRFLSGLATAGPVMVLIEDLHWADERMVGMLELLTSRSRGGMIVVATARPEFLESHPGFASAEDLTVLALRPLTDAQSERLVGELLGESDQMRALLSDVRQKADGNPFFLEEILQRLIDERAIVHEEGRWRATERAATIRLPDTIHGLLAARIDALPGAEKSVLQQAAVVGRIFWPRSLRQPGDEPQSQDLIRSLERRGLVAARPTSTIEGEPEYMFRHVLIRDVAYSSVPRARRARAHADTAAWLEQLAADRVDEFGELLAYHYAAAAAGEDADLAWADQPAERERLRRRAFEALLSAGAAARHRFAVDKAISLHEQARDLADGDRERAAAHEGLGDDHEALFHMDEAVENYFASVEANRAAGIDAPTIGRLAAKVANSAQRWGAFKRTPPLDEIRQLVDEALGQEIDDFERAELLIARSSMTRRTAAMSSHQAFAPPDRELLPEAIGYVEAGLAIARRLDDPALLYRAYEALSTLTFQAGDLGRYRDVSERAVELVDRLPSRRQRVSVLDGAAGVRTDEGRFAEALELAERAFEMAAELSAHERMHTSFTLMWLADALGRWDRVAEVLEWHAAAAAAEPDVSCPSVRGGGPLGATVLARRGELERALQLVPIDKGALERGTLSDRALIARYAELTGDQQFAAALADNIYAQLERAQLPNGMTTLIETLLALGRDEQVAALIPAARRMSEALTTFEPLADRAEGVLALRRGDNDAARPLLARAAARYEALDMPFELARTRELLALISVAPDSRALLEEALDTYRQLGAQPYAEIVEAALARLPDNVSLASGDLSGR